MNNFYYETKYVIATKMYNKTGDFFRDFRFDPIVKLVQNDEERVSVNHGTCLTLNNVLFKHIRIIRILLLYFIGLINNNHSVW